MMIEQVTVSQAFGTELAVAQISSVFLQSGRGTPFVLRGCKMHDATEVVKGTGMICRSEAIDTAVLRE